MPGNWTTALTLKYQNPHTQKVHKNIVYKFSGPQIVYNAHITYICNITHWKEWTRQPIRKQPCQCLFSPSHMYHAVVHSCSFFLISENSTSYVSEYIWGTMMANSTDDLTLLYMKIEQSIINLVTYTCHTGI